MTQPFVFVGIFVDNALTFRYIEPIIFVYKQKVIYPYNGLLNICE